jgi:hypothetical protein
MTRLGWLLGLLLMVASTGCSVCCTPYDYAYPAYGGKWERTDRFHGRVGSAFDPAGSMTTTTDGEPIETLHQPTPAVPMGDEIPLPEPDMAPEMISE